jgi:hypothetical protein
MRPLSPDSWVTIVMAAIIILADVVYPTPSWYLTLVLLGLFITVYWLTVSRHDRVFYLVCSGVLLVVACGTISIWEGFIIAWTLGVIIATAAGMRVSRNDIPALLTFGSCTLAVALMIQLANHVLLPLLVLSAVIAGIAAVLAIRDYQFRKECSGARV